MKKFLPFFYLVFFSLFISCSNNNNAKNQIVHVHTLKNLISEKDKNIKWTNEIDPSKLDSVINQKEEIANDTVITFENISILKNYKNKVYPNIEDFGNLDISALNQIQIKFINDFFTQVSKDITGEGQNFFISKYNMNYVFFITDLIQEWEENFNQGFPQIKLLEPTNENKKEEDLPSEEIPPLFEKWIIGKPYFSENLIEIPVRIFCKPGTIDVIMYLNTEENPALYQINNKKWKKNDE